MTIDEFYKKFINEIKIIYDEREASNITNWVFESVADVKRPDRIINKEKQLDASVSNELNDALQKLLKHTPVQYVLQEAWFYKMKFFVDEHVLIPRPETEELVQWAVEEIRNKEYEIRNKEYEIRNKKVEDLTTHHSPLTILDIGTGSGCIAIALKKEIPNAEILAMDVSEEALKIATKNAQDQKVKIEFIKSDFLNEESLKLFPLSDIIISNPPYIPEREKDKLDKNVVSHEPHLALFVADNDPCIFYKKIAAFAQNHLKKNGKIFVEVHEDYSKEVSMIFRHHNFKIELRKDIYGKERMVKASREN